MSYQKIILFGNLGRDPSLRYLPDGTPVCDFSLATNRRWTNSDGTKGEETVWWKITCWRRQAEIAAQYLAKGRQVLVEGRMVPDPETGSPRTWQAKDGTWRASYELVASNFTFGNSARTEPAGETPAETEDDEVPF